MLSTRRQLANNLRWHRACHDLTQAQLAERARIGIRTLANIEQSRGTTLLTLGKLSDALGVKPAALLRSRV